jgi:5,10-methylenetetrahydrofolate reductase
MKKASARGAEAEREEGLAIARELAAGIAGLARGIHVLPMGRYDAVAEILPALPARERRAARA